MALPIQELNATDTQDFYGIFNYVSTITEGYFFAVILAVVWVIIFFMGLGNGRFASRTWTTASFICSVLAIILGLLGFLNPNFIYFLVILTAFGLLWMRLESAAN